MQSKIEGARVPTWQFGGAFQEESSKPTDDCKDPGRWTMMDELTPEVEVMKFLYSMVKLVKPEVALVAGDLTGYATQHVAQALRENGSGVVGITGLPEHAAEIVQHRIYTSGLERWTSNDPSVLRKATIAFFDLSGDSTAGSLAHGLPSGALMLTHDVRFTGASNRGSTLYLPTPRGLSISQK